MSIALKQVFNKDKTFRPKRKFEPGTQRFELHKRAQATLHSGVDLKAAVQLPRGEDQNDWVAVHVVDFFNRINLIYGTICEFCTERTCPVMSGGPKYEYRWQDDMKYKKPTALPAPQYMNLLMDWIEMQINNEDIFPTSVGVPFPKNFLQICKKILCRLFRVFVHVYIHHFDRIILIGAEAHVNTCYKHFYYFVTELNLIDRKELEPLSQHKAEGTQTLQVELQKTEICLFNSISDIQQVDLMIRAIGLCLMYHSSSKQFKFWLDDGIQLALTYHLQKDEKSCLLERNKKGTEQSNQDQKPCNYFLKKENGGESVICGVVLTSNLAKWQQEKEDLQGKLKSREHLSQTAGKSEVTPAPSKSIDLEMKQVQKLSNLESKVTDTECTMSELKTAASQQLHELAKQNGQAFETVQKNIVLAKDKIEEFMIFVKV
ncbi:UNVERIFIED_CONTAM: hypothetical protein H355_015337 [Colinus virginianus]|nr:hypothetical protein H355_015337 [Colinus virginianus]